MISTLQTVGGCYAEPIVDAIASESPHIIFGLYLGVKTTLAGEREIVAVGKVDMTFPAPTVRVRISPQHANETLVAVRIDNFISLPLLNVIFH